MRSARTTSDKQTGLNRRDVGFDQAISMLPVAYRWVMMLAVTEGLTAQEIADLAGIEAGVVVDVLARGQSLAEQIHCRMIAGY